MLYLVKSGNYLKIGYTSNIEAREDSYHTENPDFEFISTREGNRKDESYLHDLFKSKIHHREWMLYDEFIVELFDNVRLPSEIENEQTISIKNLKDKNDRLLDSLNSSNEEVIRLRNKLIQYENHEERISNVEERLDRLENENQSLRKENNLLKKQLEKKQTEYVM